MSDGRGSRARAARGRSKRQRRLERAALAAVALVAIGSVGWAVDRALAANASDAADHRLVRTLGDATSALETRVQTAAANARRLAATPALQRAVAARDRSAVERILAGRRRHLAVFAGPSLLAGRVEPDAIVRSAVIGSGPASGRVVAFVPFTGALVRALERAAHTSGVGIVLVRDGQAIAGPAELTGRRLSLPQGTPAELRTGGGYRAVGVRVLGNGRAELGALLPASLVDVNRGGRHRLLFAIVATLATLVLVALTVPEARRRYRARRQERPRDRRRALGPRSSYNRSSDAREAALALVGEALAATHDPQALLPVIVDASIEATGAVGARLVESGREIAAAGQPESGRQPLQLRLGGDVENDDSTLLLYPPEEGFREDARELAGWLAAQASIALENARLHGLVKAQAVTDELTGLANRRRFMEVLALELKRAERFDSPLALVLADLDDFKLVNDRFGHRTGDDVLRALSRVLRGGLRDVDLPARLGGEEFALLLPETDLAGAEGLAERLRGELAELELSDPHGGKLAVTASFGVAVYPEAHSGDELLSTADTALYRAKAEGKNRVVVAMPTS